MGHVPGAAPRSERLAARAVDLLPSASRAIALRLAGLYRLGLLEATAADGALATAARGELASDLAAAARARCALTALRRAGVRPVVLKGRSLAERLWPMPWMRPSGDLDLLVGERSLGAALSALIAAGYAPRADAGPARFSPTVRSIDLVGPPSLGAVDLHTRLFRSVGSGINTPGILARSIEAEHLGEPVLVLDPADEVLHLVVHAAVHGTIHPKWLLDLHAAALAYPSEVWHAAADRARSARVTRPFWAAARLIAGEDGAAARRAAEPLCPRPVTRTILKRLVVAGTEGPWTTAPRAQAYVLGGILEERVRVRAEVVAGMLGKRLRRMAPKVARGSRSRSRAELVSARWLESAWRGGRSSPDWLTLRGGSMAPTLEEGDRLLVAPVAAGEIPGDGAIVIARRAGRLVAHRLVAKADGLARTRGDALSRDDSPIPLDAILATVVAVEPRRSPRGGEA
jgi:hypothetical protein